jgi:hypothetical protein
VRRLCVVLRPSGCVLGIGLRMGSIPVQVHKTLLSEGLSSGLNAL